VVSNGIVYQGFHLFYSSAPPFPENEKKTKDKFVNHKVEKRYNTKISNEYIMSFLWQRILENPIGNGDKVIHPRVTFTQKAT
jgi:hypothetical protein